MAFRGKIECQIKIKGYINCGPYLKEKKMLEDLRVNQYSKEKVRCLNPLQLALIGDGVYEVFIRNFILDSNIELSAHKIHKYSIKYLKAEGQSKIVHELMESMTEEEEVIFKRGRNAKSATVPKNADVRDYRMATGFECLLGYLYLSGNKDRLTFYLEKSVEIIK